MSTRGRILIGKAGLDGHDRGAKYVARLLRDAHYDVLYTGIRRTPEEIVERAIREGVDAIGLSVLSGAHKFVFRRVLELLRERNAGRIPVIAGGTIPVKDVALLKQWGVCEVFTPGTPAETILAAFDALLGTSTLRAAEPESPSASRPRPVGRMPEILTEQHNACRCHD